MDKLHPILIRAKPSCPFTLFADSECIEKCTFLELHIGVICLERVPNDKKNFLFKFLVARLCVRGFQLKGLCKEFPYTENTVRKWANVLRRGDQQEIAQTFGLLGNKKLTPEILSYVEHRYHELRHQGSHRYRKQIISELHDIFTLKVSGETLRRHFRESDDKMTEVQEVDSAEQANEVIDEKDILKSGSDASKTIEQIHQKNTRQVPLESSSGNINKEHKTQATCAIPAVKVQELRKYAADLGSVTTAQIPFSNQRIFQVPQQLHHLGLTLFFPFLHLVKEGLSKGGDCCLQVIAQLLQGAQNIEQNKTLNLDSFKYLLGACRINRRRLRSEITDLSSPEFIAELVRLNMSILKDVSLNFIYYDPHGKEYTGKHPLQKGWCGRIKGTAKVLFSDYLHSVNGHPLFMKHYDNFYDLRERILFTISEFRRALPEALEAMTFIVDRGIFGLDAMNNFLLSASHLITWEKNYTKSAWKEELKTSYLSLARLRNHSADKLISTIIFQEQTWKKDTRFRCIILRVTDPRGKTSELSILCSNTQVNAEEVIKLMLNRWLQENDFWYLRTHFGIDQIDTYATHSYEQIAESLNDRMVESREFYAKKKERSALKRKIDQLIIGKRKALQRMIGKQEKEKNAKDEKLHICLDQIKFIDDPKRQEKAFKRITRTRLQIKVWEEKQQARLNDKEQDFENKIKSTELTLEELEQEIASIVKEESRRLVLIEQGYCILDTRRKAVLDMLRIIARNIFYSLSDEFKKAYDNLRDDHMILRTLTESSGNMRCEQGVVIIELWTKAQYSKTTANKIEAFLRMAEAHIANKFKKWGFAPVFKICPTKISIKLK